MAASQAILANLEQVTEGLAAGAMVVIHEDTLRVRRLPIEVPRKELASQAAPPLMVKGAPNADYLRLSEYARNRPMQGRIQIIRPDPIGGHRIVVNRM